MLHQLTGVNILMGKTVLVGWDGATFSILDPLIEEGIMPFLKEFVARGTRGKLLSPPNHITPSSWTSLMTGYLPGNHGIFDFIRPEETEDGLYIKLLDSRDIRRETVWSMASRQKRSVTSLNFPLMFPPQPLAGYMIPGFVPWRHLRRAVYPSDLYERLQTLPSFSAKELAWDLDMEKKAVQSLPQEEYENWILLHIRMEQQWFEILKHLMETNPCDLTAVLFSGVDKIQHLAWRFVDPAFFPERPSVWEKKVRNLCLDYFRQLDRFLADIVRIAGDDANIFIVSDHGFGPTWDIFYLNVWLHQQGYLQWGEDGAPLDEAEQVLATRMKTQYNLFDWKKTVAYALTPSSNGIYIRVAKGSEHPGIPPEAYESFRNELINSLLAFTDPESGEPIIKRVMRREEIFAGSQMHLAPDLTIELRDQGFISILNASAPLKRRNEPKGMHRPEGIFIAAGQGIQQGLILRQLLVPDVCPVLLYSLGLEIPLDLDGQFPVELFEPSFLKANPPCIKESISSVISAPIQMTEASLSREEEVAMLSRLKALGYIE
jgi:predicted AlkP superfamily phosphohydrolase/phosphomutase